MLVEYYGEIWPPHALDSIKVKSPHAFYVTAHLSEQAHHSSYRIYWDLIRPRIPFAYMRTTLNLVSQNGGAEC